MIDTQYYKQRYFATTDGQHCKCEQLKYMGYFFKQNYKPLLSQS